MHFYVCMHIVVHINKCLSCLEFRGIWNLRVIGMCVTCDIKLLEHGNSRSQDYQLPILSVRADHESYAMIVWNKALSTKYLAFSISAKILKIEISVS